MKQQQRRTVPYSSRQHQTHLEPRGPIEETDVLRPDSTALHSAVNHRFPQWPNNRPGRGVLVHEIPILVLCNFGSAAHRYGEHPASKREKLLRGRAGNAAPNRRNLHVNDSGDNRGAAHRCATRYELTCATETGFCAPHTLDVLHKSTSGGLTAPIVWLQCS